MENESVIITLTQEDYSRPTFEIGQKIKLSKSSWWMSRQRIQNRMMVARLLKTKYFPYLKVVSVNDGELDTTLTLKPYNF